MDDSQDTSENDMSFELTGPAIIIPSNRSPKRDFSTFSNDAHFRPAEQDDRTAFTDGNVNQQLPNIHDRYNNHPQQVEVPSWMHWSLCRTLEAFQITCAILQTVYAATVMAAVAVAPAKRRLVSFVQEHPVPAPSRRLLWPRRTLPRIFRQVTSTSPGRCSTRPITLPKFRPAASSPFRVPGNFPGSPALSPDRVLMEPNKRALDVAVDLALLPRAKTGDETTHPEFDLDNTMDTDDESVIGTTSLDDEIVVETTLRSHDRSSSPRCIPTSVQELQGIREMFCRNAESQTQISPKAFSPLLGKEIEASSFSESATSMEELVESTSSSSTPSLIHGGIDEPQKSAMVISMDELETSALSSSSASKLHEGASTPSGNAGLNSPEGSNEATLSLSPISARHRQANSPLKSSIIKSGQMARIKPACTPPSKGWIHQLVSSVKLKRGSPLKEIHNGANGRQIKASKSARFSENPVSATKRFVKNETISYPSPISSRDENSILIQASSLDFLQLSPTQQEQDAMIREQLLSPSSGTTELPTETIFESDSGRNVLVHYGQSERADPQSCNNRELSGTSSTDGQANEDAIGVKSGRSVSPVSHSDDDHGPDQELPAKGEADSQADATPIKIRDSMPATPPSALQEVFEGLTVSGRRSSRRTREKQELLEKRRLEQEAIAVEEKARKDKAEAEERAQKARAEADEKARKQAEEEEERKKYARRMPVEKVIQPLTDKWENSVATALAQVPGKLVGRTIKGTDITRRDIGFVLPQRGTTDDQRGYLNDAIIEAYLLAVVDRGNDIAGHKRGETPKMHAFNNFFYDNLKKNGPEKVKRWASKAKIGGKDMLKAEWIFIPICESLHWTLLVVSGTRKTIEYFDSLNFLASERISTVKKWLKSELGSGYKDDEWKVVEDPKLPGRGKGPHQNNGSDCGVFVVTNAKMISLGVDPMAVLPTDMATQRRRLVAELINGGFTGDFTPNIVFE